MPRSSSHCTTPSAAASPNALRPAKQTACTPGALVAGESSSLSRVPGPPPRTSPAAIAPSGASTTVQPVPPSRSDQWPARKPSGSSGVPTTRTVHGTIAPDDQSRTPAPLDDAANRRRACVLGFVHAFMHGLHPASLSRSIFAPPGARGFGIDHLDARFPQAARRGPAPPAAGDPRGGRPDDREDRERARGRARARARRARRAPRLRRPRPVHRRAPQARHPADARPPLHEPGPVLRQPADRAHLRRHRGCPERQPEHDVPAAAPARGARPRQGRVGAPRASQPPLLLAHGRRAARVQAPGRRGPPVPRLDRPIDRRHRRRGLRKVAMGVVREAVVVPLVPARAFALWADLTRWPTFIDGFARVERVDDGWPAEGAKLIWQSTPDGRGRVTERVTASEPGVVLATQVFEEQLTGVQTTSFEADEEEGTLVELELDYELTSGGALRGLTDVLFIRRAQRDALVRTLRR